jgi:hypothetical protein
MRDDRDRLLELVDGTAQERQHGVARLGVEVAGRLVREDHHRTGHQRARDRDALLLAARQLGWPVAAALLQPDGDEQPLEPLAVDLVAGDPRRQQDVLLDRQGRQQIERLEDETDARSPQPCQLAVVEIVQPGAAEHNLAGGRQVEPGEQVHERRFARAGWPHDRREAGALQRDRDAAKRVHGGRAFAVALVEITPGDYRPVCDRTEESHGRAGYLRRALRVSVRG